MKLGKHVSISGGLYRAIHRAEQIGCNALQMFVKNPRGWKGKKLNEEDCKKFKEERQQSDIDQVVVHSTYLINLASPKKELWNKSVNGLKDDYSRSVRLGADYLVFHPGSHTGGGVEEGIKNIARGMKRVLSEVSGDTTLLLENVEGSGTKIGSNFEELQAIISEGGFNKEVGICVDTCHAFSAGYDLRKETGLKKLLDDIDTNIGLEKMQIIHINDSRYELGSNKDEHAHIGKGEIGKEGIASVINHRSLEELPFILETPWFDDRDDDPDVDTIKDLKTRTFYTW